MSAAPPAPAEATRPAMLNRPVPLSSKQEGEVRDLYHKTVRGYCAAEIKAFADCCKGRTFSSAWKCKEQRNVMNSCMVARATPEEFDRAREEWFRQEIEKRKIQAEKFRLEEERKEAERRARMPGRFS